MEVGIDKRYREYCESISSFEKINDDDDEEVTLRLVHLKSAASTSSM